MSRRFRICMAKGGRESLRSRYGRSKLTLISSQKKKPKTVFPKTFRPQFSKFSLVLESAVFWYIWNTADSRTRLDFENCGRKVLRNTALFLLATRVLPASPKFGQENTVKTALQPLFVNSAFVALYVASFNPLDPFRYLSSFSSWRPKTKKFLFFTNFHVPLVKKTVGLLQNQFWCHRPST